MVRESGIAATKPIFPSYLLPSLRLPFRRRSSTSSNLSVGSPTSTTSTALTTPNNSPPQPSSLTTRASPRVTRNAPDTLRCIYCSSDIAFTTQIISKGFTGRHGRAFLVSPSPATDSLMNVRIGRVESRQLVTGWHVVADISCGTCRSKLGWKYVDAKEPGQKYKVNKYILETARVVAFQSWEDVDVGIVEEREEEDGEGSVVFDSEDEDECEDIFAGTWDREEVRTRRASMPVKRRGGAGEEV